MSGTPPIVPTDSSNLVQASQQAQRRHRRSVSQLSVLPPGLSLNTLNGLKQQDAQMPGDDVFQKSPSTGEPSTAPTSPVAVQQSISPKASIQQVSTPQAASLVEVKLPTTSTQSASPKSPTQPTSSFLEVPVETKPVAKTGITPFFGGQSVRQMVKAMDGKLHVPSSRATGTPFTMTFPSSGAVPASSVKRQRLDRRNG